MSTITTRSGKGSPLTHNEVDANFTNLNSDKSEKANNLSDLTNAATARTNLGVAIGTDVQAYDADTAKYDDVTANFTGTLQNGGSNVVVDSDIGTNVQAYSSVLAGTTASFTTADETKLDGIEALADVTDATNVAAAGAVMDGDFSTNGLMKRTGVGTYTIVTDNSSEWDTAYSWGNHASAGYLTSETYTGTVTSVAATVPTGFTVAGSPVTTTGTLAISFDTGYSLPTTASQTNWNTAYGWGDHSSAGYLAASNNLSDLGSAATARTNLDVDQAGTAVALAIALG